MAQLTILHVSILYNDSYPRKVVLGNVHQDRVFRTYDREGVILLWRGAYLICDGGYPKCVSFVDPTLINGRMLLLLRLLIILRWLKLLWRLQLLERRLLHHDHRGGSGWVEAVLTAVRHGLRCVLLLQLLLL